MTSTLSPDRRERTYVVEGQLFYASAEDFARAFDFREALERVTIDVSQAHIWDISSVAALDMAVLKFRRDGAEVQIVGMNEASETIFVELDESSAWAPPPWLDRHSQDHVLQDAPVMTLGHVISRAGEHCYKFRAAAGSRLGVRLRRD